jgi:hypothetical protein
MLVEKEVLSAKFLSCDGKRLSAGHARAKNQPLYVLA